MLKSGIGPDMLYVLVLVFYLYIMYTMKEFESLFLLFENTKN